MGPDNGTSELSLKPSPTTRQRVRFSAVPQFLPVLLALTAGAAHAEGDQSSGRALSASEYFTVVGPCTVGGACARSPNYPSNYGNRQSCTITPTSLVVGQLLSATAFNTESRYDKLIVNGATYSGTTGPSNVLLGSAFTWSSDNSVTGVGWEVCAFCDMGQQWRQSPSGRMFPDSRAGSCENCPAGTWLGGAWYNMDTCEPCAHRVRLEHNSPSPTLAC